MTLDPRLHLLLATALLATLANRQVVESSGIAASRRHPGVYWTHNDSGDGPFVYAFDRTGKDLGKWLVRGAQAIDWEDMAAGPGPESGKSYLYLGDIGDNNRQRPEVVVYRVEEPDVRLAARETAPAAAFRFRYPDGRHDAEALLVHPKSGDLYIVSKARGADAVTGVYKARAPLKSGALQTLEKIAELHFPGESAITLLIGRVTGGDISPDGRRVILCDYFHGYEMTLPENAGQVFDDIWGRTMAVVDLGQRKQGEAVCYRLDGKAVLATSEGTPCPLFETVLR